MNFSCLYSYIYGEHCNMRPINLKITFMEILLQQETLLDIQCWMILTLFHDF